MNLTESMRQLLIQLNESLVLHTDGSGLWSKVSKDVHITAIKADIQEYDDGVIGGELRVYFDPASWNVEEDGLIYTDKQFLNELQRSLMKLGYNYFSDVDYSEQGMQEKDYVSLDIGEKLGIEIADKFKENIQKSDSKWFEWELEATLL